MVDSIRLDLLICALWVWFRILLVLIFGFGWILDDCVLGSCLTCWLLIEVLMSFWVLLCILT